MFSALPLCRSSFSLLYGSISPESLIEKAAELGYQNLILADRNNLYGSYDFYFAARERNINPIIGAELTTKFGDIFLIARNHDGFVDLSHLVTEYQSRGPVEEWSISRRAKNLYCIINQSANVSALKKIFEKRLYFSLSGSNLSQKYRRAREEAIKPIASPNVVFDNADDFNRHKLLRAIDGGYLLDNVPDNELANSRDYLHTIEQYKRLYSDFPEASDYAVELSNACNLAFLERKNILPNIKIEGDHFEKLKCDSLQGLENKIKKPSGRYISRLEYELNVINKTGFVDYFLIVGEIVEHCRQTDIAVVGRGSAAGSLTAFALGITEVDPIREGLYFERFLNEARSDCPDIDLDIDWRRRDELIDFVYEKYGRDHVAMMATYTHFQPRLAIRESAKALGVNPKDIDRFVKDFSNNPFERHSLPSDIPAKLRHKARIYLPVLKAARSIYGLPRHLGIHAGGIVITPKPIADYIPIEIATKGIAITQCDMYQAEKIGLVKIDLLGQRGLAVIADCLAETRKLKGADWSVPKNDPDTYQTLRQGRTIGVFQIESPGLRALLKDIKPSVLNDITLTLALIRPGASESGMKQVFLDRFRGEKETEYPHKRLEAVLKETFGVFIYQEQVLLASQKIAGFNLAASDLLRRAITKGRKQADREQLKKRFFQGAKRNGIDFPTTTRIYKQLRQFAGYGFCKAHAATYAFLAYQSCYFKTHYPGLFMTAVMRNGGGYYPSAVYAAEARRLGIKINPPDINLSGENDRLIGASIYLGINRVRDFGPDPIKRILTRRPFKSLLQFTGKTGLSNVQIENLIKIGFFDSLKHSRPELLWEYRLWGQNRTPRKNDLFGNNIPAPPVKDMPNLTEFTRFEIFRAEKEILEIPASFHPLSIFDTYNHNQTWPRKNKQKTTLTGWLADRKRIKTKKGEPMLFLTFDSLEDTFEVVLFPDIYHKFRETIRKYRYLTIEGVVNREGGNLAIIAENIFPCPTGVKGARYI